MEQSGRKPAQVPAKAVPRKPYGYLRSASVSCIPLLGTRDDKEGSTVRVRQRACKSAARRRFCVQIDLLRIERAVGMEPFMELSS